MSYVCIYQMNANELKSLQLMLYTKSAEKSPKYILLWTKFFSEKNWYLAPDNSPGLDVDVSCGI